MSRRQSLDRPGILSPPGPFLTPSPSPSISASPRLQPSPSLSPFPQDVLLVTGNPLTNNSTHEQERKTVTPGRRQSIHQFTNGSPSAGTVVFQPSPSQSPAAATSVIGVTGGGGLNVVAGFPSSVSQNTITTTLPTITTTGNELNTTLVGSNNIQLNKKGTKRQQQQLQQQQQQQQHHQIFSSSSHYSHLPSLSTTTTIAGGYGQLHATTINNTPNTFATTTVASTPKNQTKKAAANSATVLPIGQQQSQQPLQHQQQQNHQPQQQQQFQQYQTSSPLIADSPSPSPSGTAITSASIKPPTPQPPMQMLQQQFTIASNGNGNGGPQQQTFQLIQGPQGQLIAAATSHQQHQHLQQQQQQQQQQHRFNPTPTTNIVTSTSVAMGTKSTKAPQQILPKPQLHQQHQQHQQLIQQQQQQIVDQINFAQQQQKSKTPNPTPPPAPVTSSSNMSQPSLTQISQSAQPGQQQQIILPSGATASLTTTAQQPLLLNQVPMLVQQNTPQGVQLILRPPTPQLTGTPSLVIQNRAQPQLQQHQQPQQVLRILGTNGATMQLAAATPTFIVSSQANLIQQANHLQTIKTQSQSPAITHLSGLHAALSAAAAANSQQQRSQQFATTAATINGHLLSPSVAAQIQNLQLAAAAAANGNGLTAQIQMPNGLTTSGATTLLSQLPGAAQFQQNSQGFNINLNQLSGANLQQIAAAAAAGATFQTPPPPPQHTQNAANNGQQHNQQNSGNNNTTVNNNNNTATNDLFSNSSNAMSNLTQSSPAHCPVAVTPEPIRQPTPVLQNIPAASPQLQQNHNPPQIQLSFNAAATIQLQQHQQQQQQAQIQQLQHQIQQTQNQVQQAQQQAHQIHQVQHIQQTQSLPQPQPQAQPQTVQQETKKKPKPRKKKPPAANSSSNAATANNNKSLTTTANKSLNTNTSTTSVLAPTITSTSNTINMVPNTTTGQEQTGQQQINTTTNAPPLLNHINQNVQDTTTPVLNPPSSPPPQIQRASNGKLDLGNVMKLCGITDEDDEDFMDSNPTEEPSPNQSINSTQNYTISIPQPNGTSETLPYTLSIPGVQSSNSQNDSMESSQEPAANIVIKIDPSETGMGAAPNASLPQPYSITIPRLPSQEEIQKQSQQHLNNQQNDNNSLQLKQQQQQTMLTSQPLNTNITFSMPMHSAAASMPPNNIPQLISNSMAPSNPINNNSIVSSAMTTTTATTTATVKPRRKPAAKRNNKKDANIATATSINSSIGNSMNPTQTVATSSTVITPPVNITTNAISTPLATPALVPSQIGNIQISQIDNRLASNQTQMVSTPMTSLVENKIQIMPIMDKNTNTAQMPQLQQTQIVFQPNNTGNNLNMGAGQSQQQLQQEQSRPMQLVALPQFSNSSQASTTSTSTLNQQQHQPQPTLTMPSPQINTPVTNAPHGAQNPLMPPVTQTTMLPGMSGNVSISVGTPNTIAGIIPQLTGSLTLAVSEHCERLILRHDPNQPQDQQSQLILQALLKGALPNVTIINEPTKVEPPKPQQQPTLPQPMLTPTGLATSTSNSTGAISKSNKKNNKQSTEVAKPPITQNYANQMQKPVEGNGNSSTTNINNLNSNFSSNINNNMNLSAANSQMPANVTLSQQRYIALPKIDPSTQQLFSLNPLNNQITPINANQTTASIGPTERLLIAPAGINAQQLAQCLQQGQLHFNDVNPLTTQQAPSTQPQQQQQLQSMGAMGSGTSNQQPKQQIVHPMTSQMNPQGMVTTTTTTSTTTSNPTTVCSSTQPATSATTTPSTTTKQIANVAPIIDQSKAKQDTKQINNSTTGSTGAVPKKKPVRKPKASTTTAADVALMKNASVVKPMPKLDPLSQKPNNNPVQIVQPNTASGKPVVSTSTTSTTTTTTSNVVTIQPFQTQTSTGTKLVGVTAPMQQQPQNNMQQQQQQQQQTQQGRAQSNFTLNFSAGTNNNGNTANATPNMNTNQPNHNLNNGLPNNSSAGTNPPVNQQPQHTVSRVQTIQLTPQQQQMFRQVQMQIQYLTVKLQHKNLLSSMPLPTDLDPNVVAAFNKPMNDMEINTALQRLFMEQQRILAAGKEIPTPEPFITNAANAANAANSFPLMQSNNFTADNGKVNAGNIPANVVQPNNHSTLTAASNAAGNTAIGNIQQQQQPTQKIHIYPIQHKQTKQQQVTFNTNNLNINNSNSNMTTPTTIAAGGGNSGNSKLITKQKLNQTQQQQQQQLINVQQSQNNNNNSNSNNLTTASTNLVNPPPTLNPQLPQLSSLSTTPSLPSLPYPSLPPPHMINIANMPAVLQQKHFTQHLQMQQQQLMQQQQQQLQQQQKLQNSNTKPSNNFATFNANLNNMTGFQQGPPPLIFPTSTTTTNNAVVSIAATATSTSLSTIPQLAALSQQQQQTPQLQQTTQIQFQTSTLPGTPTYAVSIGNQKAYVPIITCAIATVTSSALQQTSVVSSASSMNTIVSALPQLITATASTASTMTTTTAAPTAAPSILVPTSSTMVAAGSVKPLLTLTPSSSTSSHPLNNSIVQNTLFNGGVNVNIVGNPIAQNQTVVKTEEPISPKAKLARLSLFLRQLEVDQQSSLNPDYKSPFQNKEEAVKRLIRYHCMYQTDEDIPSEEEEEFEKTAIRFQDKFRKLSGKFQQILLQESMLEHRTSEICQMEKLMIEDLRQEIEDSKQLEKDTLEYELLQQQQQEDNKATINAIEMSAISNPSPCSSTVGIFDQIKNEIKSETLDIKLNLEEATNNDSNSNFCHNMQSSSASLDSIKNEIKGEPCDNSLTCSSGVKSSCSSMDSFDLLKQTPVVNSAFKKQAVAVKEPKKEDISTQWKQSYLDGKSSNSYYNHLASASVNISKPANHVFNGVVKKQQPVAATTAVATVVNTEIKKDEKDSFENFDIESEITPSFIMKKQEPKETAQPTVTDSTAATTATPVTIQSSTNSNTKHHGAKSAKQAKMSHTFENNVHATSNITNTHSFQQNLATSSTTAQPEVVANNFDFSHHLPVNQGTTKQQEDDWLCIQKELNLMSSVATTANNKNTDNTTNNSTPRTTTEPLTKTLDFLSHTASNDLFPNGCINKNIESQAANQDQTNVTTSNCNTTLVASSCSQQNQQPSLPLSTHEENQPAADLNEFFSGSEDSEVQKDVETRLEAMFGESPVHLTGGNKERSDSPDDIESGLESIFGESNKSPSNNHCPVKEKSNWEADFAGNSFMTSTQQHPTNFMNATNSMPHHIQLGSANNPRWMQNMEAQFPDFLTSSSNNNAAVNDCLTSRKRQWNGHIVDQNAEHVQQQTQDEESPQKKMCDGSLNNGGLNDSSASSSSPLSMHQQQQSQTHHHHNLVPNDTSHAQELMDAALLSLHDGLGVDSTAQENPSQTNGFAHMMGHQNFSSYNNHMENNQQQPQHFMSLAQHQNMTAQQQQMLSNHMLQMNHQQQGNIHGHHHAGTGEFDDDITRHVQNAIDSILNLQSSEADSLSFSLDHSMGSFLGDTILNDNQSGGGNNAVSCQESTKRRQLVDELGDCLMGNSSTETPLLMDTTGTATHSQIMNHSGLHHNNVQQPHHGHVATTPTTESPMSNHHHTNATGGSNISVNHTQQQQLNDFNCVVGGIDDTVKSIMTS
ncbi:putative mediator of RNA polymerase II transcription subunit 26 [Calliphora vicina]|uniref:putative mediator of RNA polymerase II transcription subunit 26 n=1 Tax=Calliphora vicina TaxID=7373 RepID=UPI00325AF3F7